MSSSIIGMFDSSSEVASVQSDLIALGIDPDMIHVQSEAGSAGLTTGSPTGTGGASKGFWQDLKEMFGGEAEHHVDYYAEGTRRGATVVSVDAPDRLADQAADVMRDHHAVNIDDRAAEWGKSGWGSYQASTSVSSTTGAALADSAPVVASTAGEAPVALQEAEEQLAVGKRQVLRGGVRVIRRVTETPIEQDISLREEKVSVDRRTIDRPLTAAEADTAFTDKAVELTEVGEEAIAAKSAHVIGEVVVDKTAAERVETVRDSVRRSEVQVERTPGQTLATDTTVKTTPEVVTTATPSSSGTARTMP